MTRDVCCASALPIAFLKGRFGPAAGATGGAVPAANTAPPPSRGGANETWPLVAVALLGAGCFDPSARETEDSGTIPAPNAAPAGLIVAIDPATPFDDDALTCTVVTEAVDPDGDVVTYSFAWSVDGADAGLTVATVAASFTSGGQTWGCTATPTDGALDGTSATASVTVAESDTDGDGYTPGSGDCDDDDAQVNPAEQEDCATEADDNCDGTDNNLDAANCTVFYADNDGDGYGDPVAGRCRCYAAAGEVDDNTDSDDSDAAIQAGFVKVPASTFQMGCTAGQSDCDASDYDETEHSVTLTHDYFIGVTEVTQGQFDLRMGYNPADFTDCDGHGPDDCPVEGVSWYESAAYANAVSRSAGLEECYTCTGSGSTVECTVTVAPYDCDGYRLLTEAEWEGAARCGEDLLYAGSNDIASVGWTSENGGGRTHASAGLDGNACGLYDMSGNVWEWTQDVYGDYAPGAATNPIGASAGSYFVLRGGDWGSGASAARVSNRNRTAAEFVAWNVGFRLSRTVTP